MADERNPALDLLKFSFNADGAKAFLGNTRNMLFGWDHLGGLSDAANSTPGGFPWGALDFLNTQRDQPGGPTAPGAPGPTASDPVYDCVSGTCSDGSAPADNVLTRTFACTLGIDAYKRAMCRKPLDSINQASDALRDRLLTGLGITDAKAQHYAKRAVFVLLAIVVIYAALRSALRG